MPIVYVVQNNNSINQKNSFPKIVEKNINLLIS